MGSAAAWQLARAGKRVVVLEQFEIGHHVGASHGETRNISAAYPSDVYQNLLTEARGQWKELEDESGEQLIDWVGLVQHGWQDPLHELVETHKRHGIRSEFLDPAEAHARWGGLRFESPVLFTHDAGRVRAAQSLRVLRERAEAAGAAFLYNTPVRNLEVGTDDATVHTDTDSYVAADVVVTAGAWTSKLLPAAAPLPRLRVTQEQPAHFAIADDTAIWPSFMHNAVPGDPADEYFRSPIYGMLTPGEGIKAGWHGTGIELDPDERTFEYEEQQMLDLRRYVRDWIPGANPDDFSAISCTYTTTPNEDFVLERWGPLVIGAGFSGHGFKFTPAVGKALADIVDGKPAPELFRQLAR